MFAQKVIATTIAISGAIRILMSILYPHLHDVVRITLGVAELGAATAGFLVIRWDVRHPANRGRDE